jgi:isoleucyl-tRNA synthetase
LDVWILARLNELVKISTENLDNYKLLEPTRAIRDFIGDLSTWYLRRSRERIKDEVANPANEDGATQTLYFVLKNLAKILAPFAPLAAEDIWLKLKNENDVESVHLESWPKIKVLGSSDKVLEKMTEVRKIVSLGLEARQKAKIPVRQPLASLKLKVEGKKLSSEYLDLIKDELNVKEVLLEPRNSNLEPNLELDVNITPELKEEGDYRELVRALQDMRKKIGLTPSDVISVVFDTDEAGKNLIQKFENDMKKTVLVSEIKFENNDGGEVKIGDLLFRVKIEKI